MYLAIDPGVDTGYALFHVSGMLHSCGLGEPSRKWEPVARGLIECPKVYPARHMRGDPNDLIKLAVRVGRYQERLESAGARVDLVLPRDWKGTIDKEVHNRRVIRDLSPHEAGLVLKGCDRVASSKVNNVIDAIGLGKWAFSSRLWPNGSR